MGDMFVITQQVRLTCRCHFSVDRRRLFDKLPGATMTCPKHGPQSLLSRCPRPDSWELKPTLAQRHQDHYRGCNCLADTDKCCVAGCECKER